MIRKDHGHGRVDRSARFRPAAKRKHGFAAARCHDRTDSDGCLTISLVVAATAVSLGNRPLTHGELIERGGVQSPTGTLLDQVDDWLSVSARFSARAQ
jgi:hypothetical protein